MNLMIYPNKVLREKSLPVTVFDSTLKKEADKLISIMNGLGGVGISAIQVGIPRKIIIAKIDGEPKVFINVKVEPTTDETIKTTEGCLSLPGIFCEVTRNKTISVSYQDIQGNHLIETYADHNAVVILHELDHTDGILFIDRVEGATKTILEAKLKKIKKYIKAHRK